MSLINFLGELKEQGIHIRLQDDNLKISAPEGKITPMILAQIKSKKAEIIEFFTKHAQNNDSEFASINEVEKKEYYPLSAGQKRLYIVHTMSKTSITYNMPTILKITGKIDKDCLENTIRKLIERHESFRTSFHMMEDQPVQRIHEPGKISCEIENNTLHHFIRPFNLSQPPLLRVGLLEMEEESGTLLMVDMHHIISDGTSISIFTREFLALYAGQELPALRIQYKDFAVWQDTDKWTSIIKKQENF